MTCSGLPLTPGKVIKVSTLTRSFKLGLTIRCARLFRYWDCPDKKAATACEEMTLKDIFYWVYKSIYPVIKWEKDAHIGSHFNSDKQNVRLPATFDELSSLTIGAAGDLLRSDGLESSQDILYENVADLLFEQDVSYANFESPVTRQQLKAEVISDKAAPIECCNREQFDILTKYKNKHFTVLNTANNHALDMGIEGIETTLKTCAESHIMPLGTHAVPEEYGRAKILTLNGIKLGFVSATFGLNGRKLNEDQKYYVHHARLLSKHDDPDLILLKQQIDNCLSHECDFIVASLHWGYEFEFFPRHRQIEAAHELIECGVDAIFSHHPHVIQPVEYYRTKRDPNRIAIIAYSLGTLTWGYLAPHIVLSIVLNLKLSKGIFDNKNVTYIATAKVTPVFRDVLCKDGKIQTYIKKFSDGFDSSGRLSRKHIEDMKRYIDLVLGPIESFLSLGHFHDSI